MTKEVVCHKGKCEYTEKDFLDECINCTEAQIIERSLLKKSVSNKD